MKASARACRMVRAATPVAAILSTMISMATILTAAVLGSAADAAETSKVTIVVFTPPSLGAVFPTIIKQQKYDIANGVDISFVERPPDGNYSPRVRRSCASCLGRGLCQGVADGGESAPAVAAAGFDN